MTLDEAIANYEQIVFGTKLMKQTEAYKYNAQILEWLRELKAYREELPKEIKNIKVRQADALAANVKNENYNSHLAEYIKGYICALSYTEGTIAKIHEEVNADEDSD